MSTGWTARVLTVLAIAALFALAQPAAATTIGFDDLPGGGTDDIPLGSPYAGFTWSNFYVLDTAHYQSQVGTTGYSDGAISPHNVAYTGGPATFSAAQPFELDSFYVGAGWNDGMTVTVVGKLNGAVVETANLIVGTQGPLFYAAHWSGIDTVTVSSSGGTPHGYTSGGGSFFYFDNIVVNAPEPATFAIFGLGLAATVLLRRRTA